MLLSHASLLYYEALNHPNPKDIHQSNSSSDLQNTGLHATMTLNNKD